MFTIYLVSIFYFTNRHFHFEEEFNSIFITASFPAKLHLLIFAQKVENNFMLIQTGLDLVYKIKRVIYLKQTLIYNDKGGNTT